MIVFFKRWVHLFFGLVAGAAIVYVDNYAFAGEVSPIIIVAMLLAATTAAGAIWERQRVAAAAGARPPWSRRPSRPARLLAWAGSLAAGAVAARPE